MKLIWHIFQKDLRRLALPLVLWGAVIVLQYIAWHTSRTDETDTESGPVNFVMLLWVLHLVAAWLLVPQLIRDDPLIGDSAGWRVRPISGARLLAAKLLGLFVMFWLWPSLLTIPWWREFGFGAGEIARAVAVNMLGMAMFTGLSLMVAVLTENLARYIAGPMVLVVGAGLGWLMIVAELPANGDGSISAAISITRAALAFGVIMATAVVVVLLQFLTRRTALARGLVVAAALIVALIVQAWPWSAAQALAHTGLKRYTLPTVTARLAEGMLAVPPDPARQPAIVRVTTEFELKGVRTSDFPILREADPLWRFNDRRVSLLPIDMSDRSGMQLAAEALARGRVETGAGVNRGAWTMDLSGRLVAPLRNGEGVLSSTNRVALWRGELGPAVALRAGAGAARGLEQLHVSQVTSEKRYGESGDSYGAGVEWLQTTLLFTPTAMLETMNPDGMSGNHFATALLMNDQKAILDERPNSHGEDYRAHGSFLPGSRLPVGLVGVRILESSFDRRWRDGQDGTTAGLLNAGATLTSVTFQEIAPMKVALPETPFLPDLVIEGRLDEALRRAQAEDKLVLVRVPGEVNAEQQRGIHDSWNWGGVRTLLVSRFVCVQVAPETAVGRWRKPPGDERAAMLIVLKAGGEEQDRLRDLGWAELQQALQANVDGKTYAAFLADALAKRDGEDRTLRFQLHEALRARGDLAGALDAIIWIVDHPGSPLEGTNIFGVGQRLERFVATYGMAKDVLLERRQQAVVHLRQNPRDVGAARMLFAIALGLRHEDVTWREFPRLLPRENPSWWEFTRNWIYDMVQEKRYREIVDAVDLEKFFAEGPAWVRAQLLQKRALAGHASPATVGDWQRQLMRGGMLSMEALAGAGQPEAALRIAIAAQRVNSSAEARAMLAGTLQQNGAKRQAEQLLKEKNYAP